jgi:hypothetical protein
LTEKLIVNELPFRVTVDGLAVSSENILEAADQSSTPFITTCSVMITLNVALSVGIDLETALTVMENESSDVKGVKLQSN